MERKKEYLNDLSQLSDFVFELVRCTSQESKFNIDLEGEEVELFKTAFDALDKITQRVCDTQWQLEQYQEEVADLNRHYLATRGVR